MATILSEWKHTHEMTLPSGNVVELKRVALMELIAQGGIPDTLSGLAAEVSTKERVQGLSFDDLKHYVGVINLVVKAAMVKPKAADYAGPDTLVVSDIDYVDRVEIFKWVNGAATTLRPFRAASAA
jgi:hypothetical protein